jgi:hypothetical protein
LKAFSTGRDKIKNYRTFNTPLVAWLLTEGCEIAEIKLEGSSAVFYLTNVSEELVQDWHNGGAQGNVTEYYRSYKALLEQIKDLVKSGKN